MNKPEVTSDKYSKSIKISLVLCWIGLIVCCLIKLFGGNFFSIDVKSSRFIEVCNYIDSNAILLILVQALNYLAYGYIFYCAILRKLRLNTKEAIIFLSTSILLLIIKRFAPVVGTILEMLVLILVPIILQNCKWYISLFYQLLYNIFGFTSAFTKSIGNLRLPDNSLIGIIFMIDMYFMVTLFMLYNYKKEEVKNG